MEEYTVRIISHKCDRAARKSLISCIANGGELSKTRVLNSLPVSITMLKYEWDTIKTIKVIDYDWDTVDFEILPTDIIFVDLRGSAMNSPAAKLYWLSKICRGNATIWRRGGGNYFPHRDFLGIWEEVSQSWRPFIQEKFQIYYDTAIQTTEVLMVHKKD